MVKLLGKISLALVLSSAVAALLLVAGLLTAIEVLAPPSFSTSLANVENVSADAWLIFDPHTGDIFYSHQIDEVLPIASVVKLVAAHVFAKESELFATTSITWADLSHEGRSGGLAYGEIYTFHELLFPLLLESSNDAAGVFERNYPELIDEMNAYAASLGLSATSFVDASGLSAAGVSTVRELRLLLQDILINDPHIIDITGLAQYLGANRGWLNNNPFVSDPDYLGGKHGYLPEARYTATALFSETLSGGANKTIGYILLGSRDLTHDIKLLRGHVENHVRYE